MASKNNSYLQQIRTLLQQEQSKLDQKIKDYEQIKNSTPSATESHSDTTRHR